MKLTGKPEKVSKEFIRSWVNASACVLAYHNYPIDLDTLKVKVKDLSKRVNQVTGGGLGGTGCSATNTIELSRTAGKEAMATHIVHECIHVAMPHFGENTNEKCTSTLTSKLKPDVGALAQILIDGTYKRAAYIAHTRKSMAYRNPEGKDDFYDEEQWIKVGAEDKYKKKKSAKQKSEEGNEHRMPQPSLG